MKGSRKAEGGFTFLAALMMVSVMGIMLGMVGQSWQTIMQREREEELIFRGKQVIGAIRRYTECKKPQGHGSVDFALYILLPVIQPGKNSLEQLTVPIKCSNAFREQIFLRPSAMVDPMTNGDWILVKDSGDTSKQKFAGVASTSQSRPFRATFSEDIDLRELPLDGKQKYSDWEFRYQLPVKKQTQSSVTGLPRN